MSLFLAKKQENTNQKKVKDLLRSKGNKKCFDCQAKGPVFANTTIQTFICGRCSDLVREFGHRVKPVSTSKFSGAELLALKKGGNAVAQKIWESNYTPTETTEQIADEIILMLMREKYQEQKWLDRALLQSHKEEVRDLIAKSFNEDGLPIVTKKADKKKIAPGFSRLPLIADSEMNIMDDEDEEEEEENNGYESRVTNMNILPNFSMVHTMIPSATASTPLPNATFCETDRISVSHNNEPSSTTSSNLPNRSSYEMNRMSTETNRSGFSTSSGSVYSNSSNYNNTSDNRYSGNSNDWKNQDVTQSASNYSNSSMVPEFSTNHHLKLTEPYVPNQSIVNNQNQYPSYQQYPVTTLSLTSISANQPNSNMTYSHNPVIDTKSSMLIDTKAPAKSDKFSASIVAPKAEPISNAFDSIISELSGLKMEKTTRRATYTGGILAPASITPTPLAPTKSASYEVKAKERPTSMFDTDFFAKFNQSTQAKSSANDQYAALREVKSSFVQPQPMKEEDKHTSSSEDEDEEDPWQDFCSFENNSNLENEVKNVKPTEPIVSIDLFSDLDPRSMFRKL